MAPLKATPTLYLFHLLGQEGSSREILLYIYIRKFLVTTTSLGGGLMITSFDGLRMNDSTVDGMQMHDSTINSSSINEF